MGRSVVLSAFYADFCFCSKLVIITTLNTRICRYTCIYITPTVQTLHYCPAGAWRWNDVLLTSMWRHHVTSTSFWHHVPFVCDQDRCVKSCPTLKMKSIPCSVRCISNKIWTQITPFFICSAWLYVKELEKIIARTLCFMNQSFFRPNYIFNSDAYFLDFCAQKFPLSFFNVNPF